jgi:hypothetical protein
MAARHSETPAGLGALTVTSVRENRLRHAAPSTQQVDDKNHQRNNQQQMDEASADMETKSQKPQNS